MMVSVSMFGRKRGAAPALSWVNFSMISPDLACVGDAAGERRRGRHDRAGEVRAGIRALAADKIAVGGRYRALAEREGLDKVFLSAGFEWRKSGCSMCAGVNGDIIAPGDDAVSTTNRNFVGRQGPNARTHLASPVMAAAAALAGCIADARKIG